MMEYVLADSCEVCGGMCCRCIVLNASRQHPEKFWEQLSGFEVLSFNPFLPINFYLTITERIHYYRCTLQDGYRCTIYDKRPERCRDFPSRDDEDLIDFIFPVPWCYYRYKQCLMLGLPFQFSASRSECIRAAIDRGEFCVDLEYVLKALDGLPIEDAVPQRAHPSFISILKEEYRVQCIVSYNTTYVPKVDHVFNKLALLCYDNGVSPSLLWRSAVIYLPLSRAKGVPFPTCVLTQRFWEWLTS